MCGIAGELSRTGPRSVPGNLADLLAHRGPDDIGYLYWRGTGRPLLARQPEHYPESVVTFVHRRLSILDTSQAGWQPMASKDGRLYLLFNGEIYNFLELRRELQLRGHSFESQGDTEVLLTAWAEWGQDCLPRLVGMFAFAILDTLARTITLARDPFGIKPLFYATTGNGLAFASEIPVLLQMQGVSRRVDAAAITDYLVYGLTDHNRATCFADVQSLPAGELLTVSIDGGGPTTGKWYRPETSLLDIGFDEAAEQVRELFLDSVRLHLRSDVPLGTALSGGVDSSAILTAIRAILGPAADLHAFSYVADDPALSESRWLREVAGNAGARLTTTCPLANDLLVDLDRLIQIQGEPFGSTSIYAQHRVFRLAKEAGVTVMLDGQGADELFAGYPSLIPARLTDLLRHGRLESAVRLAIRAGQRPDGLNTAWHSARASAGILPTGLVRRIRMALRHELVPTWLNRDWLERATIEIDADKTSRRPRALRTALDETLEEKSLPALLRYEDRNSMAFSVESRVPFLDPRLAEFARRLPDEHLISNDGTTKAVFRRAMRGITPDSVLDRQDKIGFETPERRWLSGLAPWVRETLSGPGAASVAAINSGAVLEDYRSTLRGDSPFGGHVWRCLNLVRWSELFEVEWA